MSPVPSTRRGSALLVALWVLLILGMLIASFAYDMRVEAAISTHYRQRLKAQYLARAGVEYARLLLTQSFRVQQGDTVPEDQVARHDQALQLKRGMALVGVSQELGAGRFRLDLQPEQGRLNVNRLTDQNWEELLDQANVPPEQWAELIDCFHDYTDADDNAKINGAESDDPFYKDRGVQCKNARLDTVDELLQIKGFSPALVYGGPAADPKDEPLTGIAQWLTTWGDGKVNANTAPREVLLTIPGVDETLADAIIAARLGPDQQPGTEDDGIRDLSQIPGMIPAVAGALTATEHRYMRLISRGEVQGVRCGIWCVLQVAEKNILPLYWREEALP